jgi:hypothetical protein
MTIHIERKKSDENLMSKCLLKQKTKKDISFEELGIPALDSLRRQYLEGL